MFRGMLWNNGMRWMSSYFLIDKNDDEKDGDYDGDDGN